MKTKFAAYDDMAIYSIANTAAEALTKAHKDAGPAVKAHFEVAEITPDYAAEILEGGFNPRDSFYLANGIIMKWRSL